MVGLDGAPPHQLDAGARVPTSKRRAGWSADGAWVAFADGDAVVVTVKQPLVEEEAAPAPAAAPETAEPEVIGRKAAEEEGEAE